MPHRHRVLVVDDDPNVRALFADVLRQAGSAVATAEDGVDAVRKVSSGLRPCLVLADVRMPRMDGWEMERVIRDAAPQAAVVLVTADRLLSVSAPVRDKPTAPEEIEAIVRNYCPLGKAS
jgi:CheY-like chemotaxis protein